MSRELCSIYAKLCMKEERKRWITYHSFKFQALCLTKFHFTILFDKHMTKKHFAGTFHQAQDLYFGSSVTK